MEFLVAIVIGVLYAMGIYLIMRRSIVRLILGIGLLGHGANLLIFTIGRLNRDHAPIIPDGQKYLDPSSSFADPLPQALVLTAIVIGFGVLAFMLVLLRAATNVSGSGDVDMIRGSILGNKSPLNLDNIPVELENIDVTEIEAGDGRIDDYNTYKEEH